ncbi:MAG TPA: sugar-transfer associated ATP-grasp domain-containing protein [Sphingomicrobium sp.]|nr:sugar-transfer associated ATP-grasp domain-containing protein [Sphingomicrobium sp.]
MASRIANSAERLMYRIAGMPIAVAALLGLSGSEADDPLHSAFAWRYWHPEGLSEWSELVGGLFMWPVALVIGSLWFTWLNGAEIRRRNGKSVPAQLSDQFRLYFSDGVLAPWYYIFSLYGGDGRRRAREYLQRFETKPAIFPLLKRRHGSPLNDKVRFAQYCAERHIPCIETILHLDGTSSSASLPHRDLFVKPLKGRGGRGAERWDWIGSGLFANPQGERVAGEDLLERLVKRSRHDPIIVQPRLAPHRNLSEITSGALPTVRMVTCLDERGQPEVVAAVFRSSIGPNVTVDNMHAGGIGALVDIGSGTLSKASNLGSDAHLGWFSSHPDTGAQIESRTLPFWGESKRLAMKAHRHFTDRVVIGWDIAILSDGPILVEGNGNPDLDILQRFMPIGFRRHRFGDLLRHHLRSRMQALG